MTDEKKIEEDERANKAVRRANMLSISLAILVIIILGLKLAAFGGALTRYRPPLDVIRLREHEPTAAPGPLTTLRRDKTKSVTVL